MMGENVVFAILAAQCLLVLMLFGLLAAVVWTSNAFAQRQVDSTREFSEKLLVLVKASNAGEAVNAVTTMEHNREAIRQGATAFDQNLGKDDKDEDRPLVVEDQVTGHRVEVIV